MTLISLWKLGGPRDDPDTLWKLREPRDDPDIPLEA